MSVNPDLSNFTGFHPKPFMEVGIFTGILELLVSALSLQTCVSTAFPQVFTGIRLLPPCSTAS